MKDIITELKKGIKLRCKYKENMWGNGTGDLNNLEIGKEYVLKDFEIHSWHTLVELEGINGKFNSCLFEALCAND